MQSWVEECYGEEDTFDFYAVNINEDANHVRDYVEEIGLEIPVILGTQDLYLQYRLRGGISPYPVDYVIDGEGIVCYANHEYEPEIIIMTIDRLLDIGEEAVEDPNNPDIPQGFLLYPAYPNPFNAVTTLSYGLPEAAHVTIGIYDMSGRLITTLRDNQQAAGHYRVKWDAGTSPTGIYLVRMTALGFKTIRKLVLIR
ncbi:T9SS type A sorting domain-containing protein [bacterium]|nr:T9SS type A sorting domain-containing protein [bacterium]